MGTLKEGFCLSMNVNKCVRCGRLFAKIESPVCLGCSPAEEEDFIKIRAVLQRVPGLNAEQLAQEAEVDLACVLRMIDQGLVSQISMGGLVQCGRCGAPAISMSKRLCESCLTELDRECAEAMRELRDRIATTPPPDIHEVRRVVDEKRRVAAAVNSTKRRMVVQERLKDIDRRRTRS